MKRETYENLLSELNISLEWDMERQKSAIEEKLGVALELLNVAQRKGEEDRVKELEEGMNNMRDALDYTEDLQKSLSSGLVLDTRSEEAYNNMLYCDMDCLDNKKPASAWDEADREERRLLLAASWHSLPDRETDQTQAMLKKVEETWQRKNEPSLLADALEILRLALEKGLAGGWDRTTAEGISAYEQCLELIDRISLLCTGTDCAELLQKQEKICEMIKKDGSLSPRAYLYPLEGALDRFGFSGKYRKDERAVKSFAKRSGYFKKIVEDDEGKVTVKLTKLPDEEENKEEHPKSFLTMLKGIHQDASEQQQVYSTPLLIRVYEICRTASDYLSEYRGQIKKFYRELSAIREAGCHCGKLRESLEAQKRFLADLKETEENLGKSFANFAPDMEETMSQMMEELKEKLGQGYAGAQFRMGTMCYFGEGVEQNIQEAAKWYHKAARQGYAAAQEQLGFMYVHGDGVAVDYKEAEKWFQKAAKQYQKAAKQGDAEIQLKLGLMYASGLGVAVDQKEAVEWIKKAAEQGDADAQYRLGFLYREGEGVSQDKEKAREWFEKAAKQGEEGAKEQLRNNMTGSFKLFF